MFSLKDDPPESQAVGNVISRTPFALAAVLIALLLLVWSAVYLPWLGASDLVLEEPRRALVARTMLDSGEFFVPQIGGEIYTAKPPVFNWLIAASATLTGTLDEHSARLPSAIAVALLMVLMVYGARHWLRPWGLAFFGLALLLAPQFITKGRLAEIDTTFALLVAASLWTWFQLYHREVIGWRLWLLPLVLVALAYLTKREPAIVFFYLAVGPFLILRGQWRVLIQPGHFFAVGVATALVVSWLMMMAAHAGWPALWESLQREVLARGLADQNLRDFIEHVLTYPWKVFAAMLPFSALIPLLLVTSLRHQLVERFGTLLTFAAIAVLANLLIYWFRGDVAVRYFLPMFPFVLLIAAMVFDGLSDAQERLGSRPQRYLLSVHWVLIVLGSILALLLLVSITLPWFDPERSTLLPAPLAATIALAGFAMLIGSARKGLSRLQPVLLAVFTVSMLLYQTLHFNLLLPERIQRHSEHRNAPMIIAETQRIIGDRTFVFGEGLPLALWYYDEEGILLPLDSQISPSVGDWVLVNEDMLDNLCTRGIGLQDHAQFNYARNVLLLQQVTVVIDNHLPIDSNHGMRLLPSPPSWGERVGSE